MYPDLDDAQLMAMIVEGNQSAFSEIVTRHTNRYFALAYRSLQNRCDAEDVTQAAFVKLWQKPKLWNSAKATFSTWFYRVIINACHDHRKKHWREQAIDTNLMQASLPQTVSEQTSLEQWQNTKWRKHCVEVAIRKLPLSQRDALNLVIYCELPQKQAADVMGISLKALESLLVRGKRAMTCTVNELNQNQHSVEIEQLVLGEATT